jgi:hypothetical protein
VCPHPPAGWPAWEILTRPGEFCDVVDNSPPGKGRFISPFDTGRSPPIGFGPWELTRNINPLGCLGPRRPSRTERHGAKPPCPHMRIASAGRRPGPAQPGPARPGPGWPSPARQSPAKPSPARPGPARPGSARPAAAAPKPFPEPDRNYFSQLGVNGRRPYFGATRGSTCELHLVGGWPGPSHFSRHRRRSRLPCSAGPFCKRVGVRAFCCGGRGWVWEEPAAL